MRITLLVVGRTVDNNITSGIADYVKRLSHFTQFDTEIIPELKNARKLSEAQQKEQEGELILKSFAPGDHIVLLDEGGREFRSTEFAAWIEHKQNISTRRLVFVVGGPYGFSQKVYSAANEKLSLSRMTFSHQMIRLLFVEQLYRAYTIINHLPYHHE
ncbi:MAG: 23S rRNA (pseudouridine(1915)-N(3))-methyltransferase RlmH [Bacteroidaceae bacterium]|nr:23S rRNA (pseudouridine(1915)-N(3))-methyltransferase RlmH [Bacteroidaceae bacterium]